ncbi:MAG TPA: FkbM family methyltransferase [Candidatus Acidoferrum sp.]|jgi:FkbM family methyltransferase
MYAEARTFQSKIMTPLKPKIQGALRRAGLLNRLRASLMYDLYWRFADPQLVAARRKEMNFYRTVLNGLRKNDLIFDIGANNGTKAKIFLDLGVRVVAVEPDRANQEILKEKFLNYRMHRLPIVVVGKAVGQGSGTATMLVESPGSALNTLSLKWAESLRKGNSHFPQTMGFGDSADVEVTTIEDLIRDYGMPCYVKIDTEGYEINVLRGMRRPVPLLSFEVNLPEFRQEGLECLDILDELALGGTFNYVADYGEGMALAKWLGRAGMARAVSDCSRTSIEVFWRAPQ